MEPLDRLRAGFPLGWRLGREPDRSPAAGEPAVSRKWLPVIDTDNCNGCGRCATACKHGCLEMIWSFATLSEPQRCDGEARCQAVCREGVIQMEWVALEGDHSIGRWHE